MLIRSTHNLCFLLAITDLEPQTIREKRADPRPCPALNVDNECHLHLVSVWNEDEVVARSRHHKDTSKIKHGEVMLRLVFANKNALQSQDPTPTENRSAHQFEVL